MKRTWLAAFLAVFFGLCGLCGMGHFYVGRWRRGLVILLCGLVLVALRYIIPPLGYNTSTEIVVLAWTRSVVAPLFLAWRVKTAFWL